MQQGTHLPVEDIPVVVEDTLRTLLVGLVEDTPASAACSS